MIKSEYIAIKGQISFEKPLWATLLVIFGDVVLLVVALYMLRLESITAFVVSQLLLALFYFHNFALLHEAGHGNIHKSRWVNTLFGHYFSVFCFMPYFPWKFIHQQHHLWVGNIDKDPTMEKIKEAREKKSISWLHAFSWKSWIPLAEIAQQFVFWGYPIKMWKNGEITEKLIIINMLSIIWIFCVYILLAHLFPEYINFENFWLSYLLYMIFSELIHFPHHLQMPTFHTSPERSKLYPWEQHITTRSCDYGVFSAILALNFNLHIEHHFFPNLPWYRLKELRDILKPKLTTEYTEIQHFGWNIANRKIAAKDIILPEIPHPLLQPKT